MRARLDKTRAGRLRAAMMRALRARLLAQAERRLDEADEAVPDENLTSQSDAAD